MAIYLNGATVVGTNTIDSTATYDNLVLVYTDTTDVGTITLDSGIKAAADILLVGGGGAGGSAGGTGNNVGAGGGGGAGGFFLQSDYALNPGMYTVNVGAGGVAPAAASTLPGGNGSSSLFKSGAMTLLEAFGGGGGGAQSVGNPGASGGGGSRYYVSPTDNHACDGGAYTNGMGNVGGAGNTGRTAAGGGGASEAGSPGSTANIGGAGGAGRESNITGTPVIYAGGGGGGTRAASKEENIGAGGAGGGGAGSGNASFPPVAGTDGLGGGGGGGSLTVAGANGGSGVVIVRITLALETAVPVPTVPDVTYTGENIVAFDPKIAYLVVGGDTNATNVGEYTFDVKPADGFTWLDGTVAPTSIVWHITKKAIDFPTIVTGLAYTGELQTGVAYPEEYDQFCEFSDDSVIKAANACTYRFIVSLVEEDNTMWEDGSIAAITNYWTISPVAVEKPTSVGGLIYSGTNSIVFTEYEGVVYKSGTTNSVNAGSFDYTAALDNPVGYTNYVWRGESGDASVADVRVNWEIASQFVDVPVPRTGLVYDGSPQNAFESLDWAHYSLVTGSTTNETKGGSYEAVFHLSGNDEAENFVWKVFETSSNYTVPWSIGADTNTIDALQLDGWRIGGTPKTPTISAKWGADTAEYYYGFGDDAESVTSWTNDTDAITTAGTWVLRAVIPERSSWTAATNTTTFLMWDDPAMLFHNWTEIFVRGTTDVLSNFIVPIRVSEQRMPGFSYNEVDPSEMVFIDDLGNLLSYDVDAWDTTGESVIWVKLVTLPIDGMTVTMYWNLRDGQVPPENISTDVWSDYIGVWHMSEPIGGAVSIKDATGHQNGTGHGNSLVADGIFGKSRGRNVTGAKGYAVAVPEYPELDALSDGAFTISGWLKLSNTATSWAYLFARKNSDAYAGWAAQFRGSDGNTGNNDGISFFTSSSGNRYTFNTAGKFTTAGIWTKYDFVRSGTTLSFYLNGVLVRTVTGINPVVSGDQPFTIGGMNVESTDTNQKASTLNGYSDEVRLMPAALDSAYIAADYKYQSDPTMSTNDVVYLDGLKVDYWIVEPEMDKTTWDVSDTVKGQITNYGQLRYGEVTNYTYSVYDESETYSTPAAITNAGNYRVVFTQVDTNGYQRIEKVFEIRVTKSKPYSDIVGNGGDSGRVLLMNNHTGESGVPNIDYQGWYDADNAGAKSSLTATYWHHVNLTPPAASKLYLQNGTESILYASGGRRLWHLENCRHGNTFSSEGDSSAQNYLPYSAYSRRINEHRASQRAAGRATVGQLVMLNTTDAVVYSSCFTNGIGTIYFDAVNGWCRNSEDYDNYKIAVEYATNTVDNLAPTDDNCVLIETNIVNEVEEVTTNYYGKLANCWQAAEMIPFIRDTMDGTGTFDRLDGTNELALAVTQGGTMGNFYRIAVPIDYHGFIRFRIRRVTRVPSSSFGDDKGGFILLDNIIASVPAMSGTLESRGHFDESKTGHEILGWELATSVPYPSINDGEIHGGAKPSFFINAGDGKTTWNTNDFFQSATMHYRWRYLNQTVGPWSTIELNPNNGFKALAKFELPGRACDVEYWYNYRLQAPYYEYVDYSGIGKQIDYTEERGMQTNRLSGTTFASAGTDWFFRVREGKSDYSVLDIVFRRGASASPERVHMTIAGDHVWRGFVQTKENQAGAISYRIEALDEQTAEFAEYAATTNYFYCKTDNPKFPVSDSLESGTADSWSTLTLDAVTGYVMFQIDESSKDSLALTVVHADYQNANGWSDALGCTDSQGRGPIFVGTSTTNAYKIGVSPKKQKFDDDFSGWGNMAATNESWTFPVGLTDIRPERMYGRKSYETFAAETNGLWDVGQGMWVAKKYMVATNNAGVALQMEGNGKGYFQFYDEAKAPRGLESLSFNARLGQFVRFDDFAYYYAGNILSISNYTFMARTAFDLNSNNGFDGNASLSLVANYLPNKGCYEARWEWIGGKTKAADKGGQRLCLYRWNVTPSGAKSAELVIARTNLTGKTSTPFDITGLTRLENSTSQPFLPMFISVSNAVDRTFVVAAVRRTGAALGTSPLKTWSGNIPSNDYKWFGVVFCDTTAKRLTRGSYGVLSANCDGVFARPEFSHTTVYINNKTTDSFELQEIPQADSLQNITNCATQDLKDPEYPGWNIIPGRLTTTYSGEDVNAVMSAPIAQDLQVYLGTAGRTDWGSTPYTNIALTSFGGSGFNIPLYTTKNCSVKFAVAGTIEDVRTDIVIDSVVMKQWRGGDWNGADVATEHISPSWASAGSGEMSPIYTNFVFTSCWTKDKDILMSAKRSNFETPCAIRSPLMDGKANNGYGGDGYVRGVGLGMISFKYKDAQENAVLLLQIATNRVDYMSTDTFDRSFSDSVWTTIATNDFSKMTAQQRSSGLISTYLGLHSVTGMMRIVVSTNAIAAVAKETNTQRFGDVTITEISCIDEPPVDVHSWWGWNMRTVGGDDDTERRMFLSDYSTSAGGSGLSLALNNSVSTNFNKSLIDVDDYKSYIQHKPFVQTPTFTSNIVGEVSFKARKYASTDPHATVTIYGSHNATQNDDGWWEQIPGAVFMVTNAWYETYSCKMDPKYKAFRLAVAGVEDIVEGTSGGGNGLPDGAYDPPPRVLIDEMFVSEAVNAIMGFKNVGCFRHNLSATTEQPNVPSAGEQPICEEQWGVQCEIYGAQLASDIDFSREPRVYLHWYDGLYPWGYENWKNNSAARSARLSRATGTAKDRFVYRSSMRLSPDAVVPMSTFAPTYVQYTLEVVYYTKENPLVASTNWLTSADWQIPAWYRPLDLNAENARSGGFAAYNIIDNVAPGWAWINEVNVFGLFQNYYNTDDDCQFVEIAHPPEADMSGWTVRLLEPQTGNNLVITNVLAKFGSGGLAGRKQISSPEDATANMVFRVIANEGARRSGRLKASDGTLDAVWNVDNPTLAFTSDGVIGYYDPMVYQLVRTSGIVEHEIMLEGTNFLESLEIEPPDYLYRMRDFVTNRVANSVIILPGYDYGGASNSLGVVRNSGHNGMEEPENDWTHERKMTPGHVNVGQVIDPNHPVPSGEEVLVYLTVAGDHILQSLDGSNFTNGMFTTIVTKGNPVGTNVIYQVDPWYVLGSVTTGNVSIIGQATQTSSTQPYTYNLEHVAQGISNNVTVVASAALNPKFATEWGIPENDPYRNAIIAWLEGGTDLYGNPFAKVDEGKIQLAKFRALSGNVVTNLTLKEMYWLDMDPTIGNLSLIGGMKEAPTGVPCEMTLDDGVTATTLTNRRMTVYMMISNENDVVEAPAYSRGIHDYTRYWTPYALRGLKPGEESRGYVSSTGKWNSVTFKIAGLLLNGHTSFDDVDSKVPLRHFVFNPASFDANGLSRIEIYDPHSSLSLGYNAGWWRWWEEQSARGEPLSIIVFFWMIDTRQPPLGIEQLKETNYYGE